MHDPDDEMAAKVIAQSVVSAIARDPMSPLRDTPRAREAALAAIMIELLRIMPTQDSDQLAGACNRGLGGLLIAESFGPHVEAVDPNDGSVTMRQG